MELGFPSSSHLPLTPPAAPPPDPLPSQSQCLLPYPPPTKSGSAPSPPILPLVRWRPLLSLPPSVPTVPLPSKAWISCPAAWPRGHGGAGTRVLSLAPSRRRPPPPHPPPPPLPRWHPSGHGARRSSLEGRRSGELVSGPTFSTRVAV
jgi:hypothetical protein